MKRVASSLFAGIIAASVSLPVMAHPLSGSGTPSCDGDEKKKEKDSSAAEPQCGEGKGDDKKEKDPARF